MKKTLVIVGILLLAALIATLWEKVDDRILRQMNPIKYEESVSRYAEEYDVPQAIIYAVMKTESSFIPDAVSPRGAIGLMQITPDTFSWLCSKTGGEDNPLLLYDPDTNIRYGTYFLSLLHNEYQSWDTVYAAYNAGRGRVNSWLADEQYNNNGRLKNIPYEETANYVIKVEKAVKLYTRLYFSQDGGIADGAAEPITESYFKQKGQ